MSAAGDLRDRRAVQGAVSQVVGAGDRDEAALGRSTMAVIATEKEKGDHRADEDQRGDRSEGDDGSAPAAVRERERQRRGPIVLGSGSSRERRARGRLRNGRDALRRGAGDRSFSEREEMAADVDPVARTEDLLRDLFTVDERPVATAPVDDLEAAAGKAMKGAVEAGDPGAVEDDSVVLRTSGGDDIAFEHDGLGGRVAVDGM
jgi:hypothetical protein